MKKSIIATILSVGSIAVVTPALVFLPAYASVKQYYLYDFDYMAAMSSDSWSLQNKFLNATDYNFNHVINGTKSINNGNYMIYIGSESNTNTLKFLYNINTIDEFEGNYSRSIRQSEFGYGFQEMKTPIFQETYEKTYNTDQLPKMLTFIDKIDPADFIARENFSNTIREFKQLPTTKEGLRSKISDEIKAGNANINETELSKQVEARLNSLGQKKIDEILKENSVKKDWAGLHTDRFTFAPGEEYETWDNKIEKFRVSSGAADYYLKLKKYVTSRFPDANSEDGILILFKQDKNGNLVSKIIANTTDSGGSGGDDNNTGDGGSSGDSSTRQLNKSFFQGFKPKDSSSNGTFAQDVKSFYIY